MMRFTGSLALLTVIAGCAGADEHEDGTLGTERRVAFAYQRGCFFGCPIGQPLLAGSQQTITLSEPGDAPGVRVESSDPAIAEFALQSQCFCDQAGSDSAVEVADDASCRAHETKRCENSVLVQAGDAGDVLLELRREDDSLLDRIGLEVREAERARFAITLPGAAGPTQTEDFELRVGDKAQVEATLYDDEGRELLAPMGVHWSVDDASVATVSGFLIGGGPMLDDGLGVDLNAVAPGDAMLSISVPGLDEAASVHVGDAR